MTTGADSLATALTTFLAGLTGYSSASVKRADWSVLNAGVSKAIVVEAGDVSYSEEGTAFATNYTDIYDLVVNLCVAYRTDVQADSDLATETDAIKVKLRQRPMLSGTAGVMQAWLTKAAAPAALFDEQGGGPHWWMRSLTVRVMFADSTVALE